MKETIRALVETFGPSGAEDRVRAVIRQQIEGLADEMYVDTMGNLIAVKKGSSGFKIMLSAHMDEIGLIVGYIDEKGFARVNPIGGVRPHYELMGRVLFENGTIGVIGADKLGNPAGLSLDKLYIDVGATSREDCPIKVGDVACFLRPMVEVGGRLVAKAMDDRIGCAVLVQALRELAAQPEAPLNDIYFVFSTQEELGLRGATTSAYGISPDVGIALDVTLTGDTPETPFKMAVSLDAGPAIKVKDGGMLATPWVKEWMVDVAEANEIPYQLEVLPGGTTDARAIQTTQAGIAAGCLSIPTRYVHSPSEMVSYADVLESVKLLAALISGPVPAPDLGR